MKRAKELARLAFDVLRFEQLVGNITVEGEQKQLREFAQRGLSGSLLVPFRPTRLDEFSRLQVRHLGRRVLEIRWSKAGDVKLIAYEPGQWEELLEQVANVF
ncbi:hypothetical protein IVB15_15340 [Bradyrhizobium sp. 182]|uniref:hypothetical protein n=1 Tax=unclassified Bradyrhizobium TaxID=2631580 RepID=UPI001FF932F4|nr:MULTISPECIES: hypothetical protein [unclassified Bradyrhizobium]MCK1529059.1 hypothetical protein [Bradyrhizobium sp. 182]MCK1595880.1 hypothetical protein [Bradyrhizobium sp. 164]